MELQDFARLYVGQRTLCANYAVAVQTTARLLTERLGGSARTRNLDAAQINIWLAEVETRSAHKASSKRRHVRSLWQAAWEQGLAPPVGFLRRIRVPRRPVVAITIEQFREVLKAADGLRGFFSGTAVPRRSYWRSLLLAAWDSGLRISDLRSIERSWIWPSGVISLIQRKTGFAHRVKLRPETIEAIDLLLAGRTTGPIWSTLNSRNFYKNLGKLSATAGVPIGFKLIRRASASYVERDSPGRAWKHLGHAGPGLAEVSYIDPNIAAAEPTLPPAVQLP